MLTDESRYAHRIWRSLDAESSFFGIKGRFMLFFMLMAAAGAVLGFCMMALAGNLVGTLTLAAALAGGYLSVMAVQARMTVRQFSRMISKRKLRQYGRVRPLSVKDNLNSEIIWK